MIRDMMLFIKYPYTAGVIATMWLGSAGLIAINRELPLVKMVAIDMIASVFIAFIGFSGKSEV